MTATPILPSGVLPVATAIDLVQVSSADPGQVRAVQDVIAASEDFAMLVDGFPPPPDEAEQLLAKIPPGSHPEDKAVMLVRLGTANIGVLDVVRDWPQRRTWMIGLLVLVPAARGRGVGGRVVATVDRWAIESGAKKLRVAVSPANVRGLRSSCCCAVDPSTLAEPRRACLEGYPPRANDSQRPRTPAADTVPGPPAEIATRQS